MNKAPEVPDEFDLLQVLVALYRVSSKLHTALIAQVHGLNPVGIQSDLKEAGEALDQVGELLRKRIALLLEPDE